MTTNDLIPISDRLYLVDSPTRGRFPFAFSFLIKGTDTHALIDTGCGPEACKMIMEKHGVDVVINSHCHPDHVTSNHLFAGKALWVPEERVAETGAVERLAKRLMGPNPAIMSNWKNFVRNDLGLRDYTHTRTFTNGERLDFGGISLEAIHTPGHLADHYCFREPDTNLFLTFDIDLTTFGPFYGNPEADISFFKKSLDTIIAMQPTVVASSHRLPVYDQVMEELQAFKDKFKRNQGRVAAVLDAPLTLNEICALKPIYRKYIPGLEVIYSYFERHMVEKHLSEMEREGVVEIRDEKYFYNKR